MRISGGRWIIAAGFLLVCGLLVAACGSNGDAAEPPVTEPASPASEVNQPAPPPDATATPRISVPGESPATPTPATAANPTATPNLPAAQATATPRPAKPTPTPIPTPSRAQGSTGRVTMTRAVDARQRPTEPAAVFGEDERAYVSVEFIGVRKDAVLGVRWLRGDEESFVFEMEPTAAFSRGFFAFFFDPGGSGSAGNYSVEVLIGGEVVAVAEFEVRADGGAPPAG